MKRFIAIGVLVVAGAGLVACATTKFTSSWKAPDVQQIDFKGKKVAAVVINPHESVRLGAEGALARELVSRGVQAIPAYNLIPPNESRDREKAKALFTQAGIAGVVVMRALATEKELTYSASAGGYWGSPYYGSLWGGGYWGYGWGSVYDPGYLKTDTIVHVETLVYDMKADKLLWAGRSETTNPDKVDALVQAVAAGAAAEMKKQGLIK